jgi:hypothetical protein
MPIRHGLFSAARNYVFAAASFTKPIAWKPFGFFCAPAQGRLAAIALDMVCRNHQQNNFL